MHSSFIMLDIGEFQCAFSLEGFLPSTLSVTFFPHIRLLEFVLLFIYLIISHLFSNFCYFLFNLWRVPYIIFTLLFIFFSIVLFISKGSLSFSEESFLGGVFSPIDAALLWLEDFESFSPWMVLSLLWILLPIRWLVWDSVFTVGGFPQMLGS